MENVAHALEPVLQRAGVSLHVDLVTPLPEQAMAADQFEQALVALVTNAVEASEAGDKVRISVKVSDAPGQLVICVVDEGCGIPRHLRNQIFDPFFTTKPQGNGIGLPMVKSVVESHGGTITVEEPEEGGSRFVILLPLSPDRRAEDQALPAGPDQMTAA
jgi:signal transduction histidine kinase